MVLLPDLNIMEEWTISSGWSLPSPRTLLVFKYDKSPFEGLIDTGEMEDLLPLVGTNSSSCVDAIMILSRSFSPLLDRTSGAYDPTYLDTIISSVYVGYKSRCCDDSHRLSLTSQPFQFVWLPAVVPFPASCIHHLQSALSGLVQHLFGGLS